jgi:hypothetical protein
MKTVKLSINSPKEGLLRQTPGNDGIWGDFKFYINEEVNECDFWVVYSKGQSTTSTSKVAPDNLIFISGEPEPVYHYAKPFIKKFGLIVTSRRDIVHPNIIFFHTAQPWWVGRKMNHDGSIEFKLKYNDFNTHPRKEKLISVVTSNKGFTRGHLKRIGFVNRLKKHFGDRLEIFGRGINGFQDKWDVLKDYKYHIAIENSSYPDYWTEKLSDCFLAETFPFYYGCKNPEKYFSPRSYEVIDIANPQNAIRIIEDSISQNLHETNRKYLLDSKQRVMEEHNLFPVISRICDSLDTRKPREKITIRPEIFYFDPHKIPMMLKRYFLKFA